MLRTNAISFQFRSLLSVVILFTFNLISQPAVASCITAYFGYTCDTQSECETSLAFDLNACQNAIPSYMSQTAPICGYSIYNFPDIPGYADLSVQISNLSGEYPIEGFNSTGGQNYCIFPKIPVPSLSIDPNSVIITQSVNNFGEANPNPSPSTASQIQVPLNGFVSSGTGWVWPSAVDPVVTLHDVIYSNEYIAPVFSENSVVTTLTSNTASPGTAFVEINQNMYSVAVSLTVSATGNGVGGAVCTDKISGNSISVGVGATIIMQSTPVTDGASASIVCGMGDTTSVTLVINSITLTPISATASPSPIPSPNSTITLVQGKNTAILATVTSSFDPVLNDQEKNDCCRYST